MFCCPSQGFPLQAEYQSMVNVTSSAGPGLSPSMDYRTGCRNGPTQGLDWTSDYCSNGWADTSEINHHHSGKKKQILRHPFWLVGISLHRALQRDKALYLTWSTCPTARSFTLTGPRQFLIPVHLFRAWLFRPYFRLDTIHTSANQRLNVFFLMAHTLVHPTMVALEFVSPSSFWHSDILDL